MTLRVSKFVFKKAQDDFLALQPEILEQQAKLKQLRKEQKANTECIKQYMEEHELNTLDVGGYEFSREEVTRCSFTEKNLEDFLEDPSILDNYREAYAESKQRFKLQKPKRRRRERGSPSED
jgi:hypothetical protein